MTTLSHVITTAAVSSGKEHARIVLNLREPRRPAIVMTSGGSSSGIPPSTGTDSGYASITDGSLGSFCKGSIEGIAIPGSKLWPQKVRLKVFSKPASEAAENRFADLMEFIPNGLEDYISRARLVVKPYSIILKVLGEDEATAKPWIFIQCDKTLTRKMKQFFKQDHIKSEYHPTSNDELMPPFRICLCERPPRKIAATDTVDVYGQSHIGQATSSAPCCIRVIHPNGISHIGTLGGLVKISTGGGIFQLCGMTVGHIFAGDDFLDDDSQLYESIEDDTDEDEDSSTDNDDVVELELASLDDDGRYTSNEEEFTGTAMDFDYDNSGLRGNDKTHSVIDLGTDGLSEVPWSKLGRLLEVSRNTAGDGMNFDWGLVAIEDFLLYDSMAGTELIHAMQVDGKLKESHEDPGKRRSSKAVTVSGGASGTKDAILSASWSYLQLSPGKSLVKTYTLISSNHRALQEGDCGAWVVDKQTYELYGYVVASGLFGEAYVVPLESSFKNVKDQLGAQHVCLPGASELDTWLHGTSAQHLRTTLLPSTTIPKVQSARIPSPNVECPPVAQTLSLESSSFEGLPKHPIAFSSFPYTALNLAQDDIRLVKIEPSTQLDDPIKCSLLYTNLRSSPSYQALSYTWDQHKGHSTIQLESTPFRVTQNLETALRNLRQNRACEFYWIDSICINQQDDEERGHQVNQMRQIYENASSVLVWLGPASETSASLFDSMETLSHRIIEAGLQDITQTPPTSQPSDETLRRLRAIVMKSLGETQLPATWLESMSEFLKRRWWSRAWVHQELAVSQNAQFQCGRKVIDWNDVYTVMCMVRYMFQADAAFLRTHSRLKWLLCRRDRTTCLRQKIQARKSESLLSLLYTLITAEANGASDDRDRIYALLAITSDDLGIYPDYSVTTEAVYSHLIKAHILHHFNQHCQLSVLSIWQPQSSKKHLNLPSWVPDWSMPLESIMAMAAIRPDSKRLYFPYGRKSLPSLNFVTFEDNPNILTLLGLQFDTICALGPSAEDASIRRDLLGLSTVRLYMRCQDLVEAAERFVKTLQKDTILRYDDELWRILILDRDIHRYHRSRAKPEVRRAFAALQNRPNSALGLGSHPTEDKHTVDQYSWTMAKALCGRRLACSSKGHILVVSDVVSVGDQICIFPGSEVPFVLRERKDAGTYFLMGEAYVHGGMDGEMMDQKLKMQLFRIH